ncbi:hypothetical protein EVAR_54041_1 [Eumeta japonica]|uniref:Mariner Mos1 transposase n=1 Tax=Eumeta variegata TaxID=151549 RepID=A0A4C1YNP7_EUMVA|nr:hypothetical protein EVAR_54041_1 [Eumeta japonica]
MIETDNHVTYHDIRAALVIGMSQIQLILHKHLGMKKLCSWWIAHNLTEAQKRDHVRTPLEDNGGARRLGAGAAAPAGARAPGRPERDAFA